ncbi:ribose ABC transporter substrate-binding protein [Candidatus Aerophobetes bacterium]|uniref:Ribose ABC transporter substrate-binding protein n=1 Tax=Aerophobetes bacterium TaxID=2030807 RepID=A0A662DGN6_UNCAE|nr:MAG: ribose ABC transporter substrate-binding protein [Candidatus Aerophobetes bacterium]
MDLKKMCVIVLGLVGLVAMTLVSSPVIGKERPLIAFSQCTMNHPWRVTLTNDMKYWAAKLDVNFIWADGNNDAANQLADCEDLIAKKPDVLVISPLQAKALAPVYDMCNEAKVPLIVIDRYIDAEPGTGMYITFIGEDQMEEGRTAARLLVKKLFEVYGEYKGNIVELQGTIGAGPTIDRHKGFLEIIDKYPDIQVVATQSADYLREPAMKIMEDWLQRFPKGTIHAVYAHNDEMALGAMAAIKAAGRNELLGWICSIDGQVQALKAVLDGEFLVSVQNPPYFGESSIKSALRYLEGYHLPAIQWVPFKVFHAQTPKARAMTEEYYNYLVANDLYY